VELRVSVRRSEDEDEVVGAQHAAAVEGVPCAEVRLGDQRHPEAPGETRRDGGRVAAVELDVVEPLEGELVGMRVVALEVRRNPPSPVGQRMRRSLSPPLPWEASLQHHTALPHGSCDCGGWQELVLVGFNNGRLVWRFSAPPQPTSPWLLSFNRDFNRGQLRSLLARLGFHKLARAHTQRALFPSPCPPSVSCSPS